MAIPTDARLFAVVPAAGSGTRMGASLPKQYLSANGRTIAEHTIGRLLSYARIEKIIVATAKDDLWWPQLSTALHPRVKSAIGGATRAESVLACLDFLSAEANDHDWVLVHDMARPCVRLSDIELLLQGCTEQGALLALPVTDTIKQADGDASVTGTLSRDNIWRALTPQLFPLGALRDALTEALAKGLPITDEASAMELRGGKPRLVVGRSDNIKVTLPADLPLVRFYLSQQEDEGLAWEFA
ncbi:MAG: 2-C-methyl-D-erythritol 4-phosphate cytidylyltransferase [Gammaproteobacteria bacterium]|jgi:2-C-methyl-D-erythritol 4-phosphate cytidylyltransferase|nr:2-C-methyl-D-erythritol 4-phosphate cytidylyltransferase [Gammaproteobacteria bacterium]MBQ0775486.1 2-C-methyl-D-erythritol 4-phosphate cytidylyltransferase [Gammaproteobacteria bacterium]|tara:strand:- start:16001 stop:16729 length:729 start_codon:yes stop_codon:yes gene_type:complete